MEQGKETKKILTEAMKDYKEKRYGCALEKFHNLYLENLKYCCPFIADCYHHLKYYSLAKEFFEKVDEYPRAIKDYYLFKLKLIDCYDNLQDFESIRKFINSNKTVESGCTDFDERESLVNYAEAIIKLKEHNNVKEAIELFKKCNHSIAPAAKEYIKQIEEIKQKNKETIVDLGNELKKKKSEDKYCELIELYLLEDNLQKAQEIVNEFNAFVSNNNDKLSKYKVSFYKGKIQGLQVINDSNAYLSQEDFDTIKGHLFSDFLHCISKDSIEKIKHMYLEAVDLLFKVTAKSFKFNKEAFEFYSDWLKKKTLKMVSKEHYYLIKTRIFYTKRNAMKTLRNIGKYTTFSGKSGLEIEKMKKEMETKGKGFDEITHEEEEEENIQTQQGEDSDQDDIN